MMHATVSRPLSMLLAALTLAVTAQLAIANDSDPQPRITVSAEGKQSLPYISSCFKTEFKC